jgi:hypothetical protein
MHSLTIDSEYGDMGTYSRNYYVFSMFMATTFQVLKRISSATHFFAFLPHIYMFVVTSSSVVIVRPFGDRHCSIQESKKGLPSSPAIITQQHSSQIARGGTFFPHIFPTID